MVYIVQLSTSQFQFQIPFQVTATQYKLLEFYSFHPRCSSEKTFELTEQLNIEQYHMFDLFHFTPIDTMMIHIEPEQYSTPLITIESLLVKTIANVMMNHSCQMKQRL